MVIRAERPIIDKNATNAVRIVNAEDLEILPLRGVGQVLALQTGVVEDEGTLHIRGSRGDEIGYYVEGASVRNVVTGGSAVGLIVEALEEIQLQGRRLQRRVRRCQRRHYPARVAHRRQRLGLRDRL